jgi:hypothetical protein
MMRRLVFATYAWCVFGSAVAYEVETHQDLSRAAVLQSLLGDAVARARLGLTKSIENGEVFPNSAGVSGPVIQMIRDGATFEDNFPRSIHHFFNPQTGSALSINPNDYYFVTLAEQLTAEALIADVNAAAQASPDWALAATPQISVANVYSFKSAREYFYQGLTNPAGATRNRNLGLMFESMGRLIHHIQDMAQPQHVRNDAHLHDIEWERDCVLKVSFKCDLYRSVARPSAYEHWTNRDDVRSSLPLTGYAPVYAASGQGADGLNVFTYARWFWSNSAKGVADFTYRNFVSAGTMQVVPPSLGKPFQMQVAALCAGAVPSCEAAFDSDDVVTFFPSVVDDQFRPASMPNPYAAAASIFDPEFTLRTGTPLRTVNRFTFANDHFYLLPRAVGYSAGLINYFFRGDMEITLPDESVYAVVDQNPNSCGNPCGFRKLKLKLKNITAGNEVMGAGTLRAVVKYHSNICYRPDLAGEYGGDPAVFNGNVCRSPEEYVAVSQPVTIADGEVRADRAKLFTFQFDDLNPIPIRAADAYLQVVFRGRLGQEDDAVAVTTKNIVEPNFLAVANMTDYAFDDVGDEKYHAIPYKTVFGDLSVANFGIAFGSSTTPVATTLGLKGGQHAQIAFLTDTSELPATVSFSGYQDQSWVLEPEEFALDDTTGQFLRSCPVFLARGVYRQYLYWFYNPVSAHGLGFRQISSQRGETAAGTGGGKFRKHSTVNYDCRIPTGGVYDFSAMTPLSPATALPWAVNF